MASPVLSEDIVGYPISSNTRAEIVAQIMDWIGSEEHICRYFACANIYSIEVAETDPKFRRAMQQADILTPDGIGIIYASRLFHGNVRERVTGMDVFLGTCEAMQLAGGGSCFFLGSTEETLSTIRQRMQADFPAIEVAGTYSPPFRPEFTAEDNEAMLNAVNSSGAQVLWVGLTAPKQEKWIYAHRDRLAVSVAGPVGAVFDFFAGKIGRAGPTMRKFGLEWLHRLASEPRRMWPRYHSVPKFVARVASARIRR
jgi:N-acetylglucosaminyldiphosphoundecaprenol N-acetyl-beta-D-mannosaminyltransferase